MKNGMMISCRDATELVIRKNQEELSRWDRFRLKFHLLMCKFCSLFEKQNAMIDEMAAAMDGESLDTMPEEVRERMLGDLSKEG